MLQFNLSKNLEKDMASCLRLVVSAPPDACQWYLQKTTIMHRQCVLAMEGESRYAMLFCGMTKRDFISFPQLFRERLRSETRDICRLDGALDDRLSELLLRMGKLQYYRLGYDRSVMAHMREAIQQFRWEVEFAGRLPANDDEHFAADWWLNDRPRWVGGNKDCFWPLAKFRDGWLRRLGIAPG